MSIYPYHGVWPTIAEGVFIAPGARIIGDVQLGPGVSVWYNVVIRADTEPVRIGARTNIQDNTVIHVDPGAPCIIGEDCVIGHSAIVHGARLGDRVMVAIHATVLSHSSIGDDVIIGAGALIPEHKAIEAGVVVMGVPGKVIRPITAGELARVKVNAQAYLALAAEHRVALATNNLADGSGHGDPL